VKKKKKKRKNKRVTNVLGSLPVYMGAPNIDDWLPGKDSVVKTSDFKSPEALAAYLKKLLEDEKEYKQYFNWKKQKLSTKVCLLFYFY
jgi:hypothetical protein